MTRWMLGALCSCFSRFYCLSTAFLRGSGRWFVRRAAGMVKSRQSAWMVALAALGLSVIALATNGFQAFTTEGARRLTLFQAPRELPMVELVDHGGRSFSLDDFAGRIVLVEFIYTRCATVCNTLQIAFHDLNERSRGAGAGNPVLIGITLDSAHDDVAQLAEHAEAIGIETGDTWRLARARTPEGLRRLLNAFGVIVVPDGAGGFVHNATVQLIDRRGRFSAIINAASESMFRRKLAQWL